MPLSELPRIERLTLARVTMVPDWHPEHDRFERSPVHGWVIRHPDGVILVDTGIGEGNDVINRWYRPHACQCGRAPIRPVFQPPRTPLENVVTPPSEPDTERHLLARRVGGQPAFSRRATGSTDVVPAGGSVDYTAFIPACSTPTRRSPRPNPSTGPTVPLRWSRLSAARIAPHARIAAVKS